LAGKTFGNNFCRTGNFFVAKQATLGYRPGNMDGEADITTQLAGIGFRLRELRSQHGWTLEELAERSGLSKPFLSRLEAGGRQPSIAALLTLARAFGVAMGAMFESSVPAETCVIVRGDRATVRRGDGLKYAPLSNTARFANLQPMKIVVSHRRKGDEQYQHEGEEWLYVLSGRLRVLVAGASYDLESGDSAHFDSRQPHRLSALDGRDAELILVACPVPETEFEFPRSVRQHRAIR
jgi:transcriptional regulator with XRE-family HTH domain